MTRSRVVIASLLTLTAFSFSGCAQLQQIAGGQINQAIKDWIEPLFEVDSKPPPGYKPIFLKTVKTMPTELPDGARLEIKSVDSRTPGVTRMQFHILDENGTFYKSASKDQLENMVCEVVETVNGRKRVIKNVKVSELTSERAEPMALALITDNSGSMGKKRATTVQEAIAEFAKGKDGRDALSVVRYDNKVKLEVDLTTDKDDFLSDLRMDGLNGFGGGTAILDGTKEGIEHLANNAGAFNERYAVVFTDGQENASKTKIQDLIRISQEKQVPIIAVDFGARINAGYMESLARATGGSYYHIYLTEEFEMLFDDIYRRTKNAYTLEYASNEYGAHTVEVNVCVGKGKAADTVEYDNSPAVGTVSLIDVHFDVAKSIIRDESNPAIQDVADLMKKYPGMTIELRGHTDSQNSTGDPDYNNKLSQSRAEAVMERLVSMGIDDDRMSAKGYGESMPVATNDTPEGRQRNRRTEFVILSK